MGRKHIISITAEEITAADNLVFRTNKGEIMFRRVNADGSIATCKDCKHCVKAPSGILCCGLLHGLVKMTEDSFCSYGERKEIE